MSKFPHPFVNREVWRLVRFEVGGPLSAALPVVLGASHLSENGSHFRPG